VSTFYEPEEGNTMVRQPAFVSICILTLFVASCNVVPSLTEEDIKETALAQYAIETGIAASTLFVQ
jgi:hypothetical protein